MALGLEVREGSHGLLLPLLHPCCELPPAGDPESGCLAILGTEHVLGTEQVANSDLYQVVTGPAVNGRSECDYYGSSV